MTSSLTSIKFILKDPVGGGYLAYGIHMGPVIISRGIFKTIHPVGGEGRNHPPDLKSTILMRLANSVFTWVKICI